ncbi:MAG: aminotransferase class V-fold PLP-dependent enzyme [Longimicrobiales bacterium]
MHDRRAFLTLLGGASLAWPRTLEGLGRRWAGGGGPEDRAFWQDVRAAFLIPEDRIYLNNGTLGPPPRVVVEAVEEHGRRVAATVPPGVAWDDLKAALSGFLGGDPGGWVVPRNTTEAMNFVAHGLDLGPGDEVLTTDHEHIGGLEPWRLVTARRGATLRVVSLPVPARSPGELLEAVWAGVGPRTRVVSVSHVTFTTGTTLPVADLAARCAGAGVVLAVDGAHPPGMMQVDLGVPFGDFYASSPHKWMLAAQGTGLLYLTEPWRERLWPTLASGGWDDRSLGAQRFNHMGTMDESRMAGLLAAIGFLEELGMERVEARVRALRRRLRTAVESLPGVRVVTPADEALASGMLSFGLDGVDSLDLQAWLSRTANVRTRVIGEYDYGWMRLSTHVYNTEAEIDRVSDLLARAVRSGVPSRTG